MEISLNIELYQLLVNTSLFILIWIVQLVIYPGFTFYQEEDIKKWHPLYARRITYIVMPLMLSQLVLYAYSIMKDLSIINGLIIGLIVFNWIITFLIAIPLHSSIDRDIDTLNQRKRLIKVNWYRTFGWTIILIISFINYGT